MSDRSLCTAPPRALVEETVTVAQVMDGRGWLEGARIGLWALRGGGLLRQRIACRGSTGAARAPVHAP